MLKRLRVKLVSVTMLIVTLMLCIILGTVLHFTKQNLENESIRMMEEIVESRTSLLRQDGRASSVQLPYFMLQITRRGTIYVLNNGGFDLSDTEKLTQLYELATESDEQTGLLESYGLRYYKASGPDADYIVFADVSSEQSTLYGLLKTSIIIGIPSLLVFLFITILFARWAVRPVEQAFNQQRQFVSDASHELKTPLTVILTNAELLRDVPEDDPRRPQFLGSILTMTHRMRSLTESLLELARADNGNVGTLTATVDYSALVSDSILPFEALFFENSLALQTEIEPEITVKGDSEKLRQVTEILLDNAQKYARPGTTVCVNLASQGRNHCLLTVSNMGDPISREDLKNIFKRFYRVEKSRSVGHSYGLGLPIAESIVTAHGGKIHAESRDGWNIFYVKLPTGD